MKQPPAAHELFWAATLLLLAIVIWGVNWPVMKIGLDYITPVWFSFIRISSASLCLFLALGIMGRLSVPARQDWPVVLSVGVLQVGLAMGLIHFGLLYVEPGRSAVLTYTVPIWIAPLALLFLGEELLPAKLAGLVLGIAGIAVLFNPLTFPWGNSGYLFGNLLLIIASLMWAVAIVHVRGHSWSGSTLSLLPWQLLAGAVSLLPMALIFEGLQPVKPTWDLAAILFYNGPVASAFGFYAFISASRALPANTTGMATLAIPIVGILSSVILTGEILTGAMIIGLSLIGSGVLLANRKL